MSAWLVPLLIAGIVCYAKGRNIEVFPCFLRGAQSGLQLIYRLAPTMIGMLTVVSMLRASGFIEWAGAVLTPILRRLGIPAECAALILLKPVSGGGGLALGTEIMKNCGADSYAGRVAAVMLGASETSLYTISVYSSHIGLEKTRYAVPAALAADLTAFISAAFLVRVLFS